MQVPGIRVIVWLEDILLQVITTSRLKYEDRVSLGNTLSCDSGKCVLLY